MQLRRRAVCCAVSADVRSFADSLTLPYCGINAASKRALLDDAVA